MLKFACNKLTRDKTIERMNSKSIKPNYIILDKKYLPKALNNKLLEEANEVINAQDRDEMIAEIADVLEVIDALCKLHNISHEEILKEKAQIKAIRGTFDKGIYIKTIEMQEDNPNIDYYLKNADRYPQI